MNLRKRLLSAAMSIVLTVTCFSIPVQAETLEGEEKILCTASLKENFSANEILVVMKKAESSLTDAPDADFFDLEEVAEIENLTVIDEGEIDTEAYLESVDFHQILKLNLNTNNKGNVLALISRLEENDAVLSAAPNYYDSPADVTQYDYSADLTLADLPVQWALERINAPAAWKEYTNGSPEVQVGIIDTGIANHPDLQANLGTGYDFYNDNEITTDDTDGHGTHVAGIIGANGDENGVRGIAPNVTLIPLQIADQANNFPLDIMVKAITYANEAGIPILNYSGYGYYNDAVRYHAIKNYFGLFVCPAGNDTQDNDKYAVYPACHDLDNIIVVASSTYSAQLSWFSNYGAKSVDLAAPGSSIYSTYLRNSYTALGGTSQATPFVAGAAALYLSQYPGADTAEIKAAILNNTDTLPPFSGKCVTGGRLNVYKMLYENNTVRVSGNAFVGEELQADLTLDDSLSIADLQFQWQNSKDNLAWNDIDSATQPFYRTQDTDVFCSVRVQVTRKNSAKAFYSEPVGQMLMLGDVNLDGTISNDDVQVFMQYLAELIFLDELQLTVADIQQNGNVNTIDILFLQRYIAGMNSSLNTIADGTPEINQSLVASSIAAGTFQWQISDDLFHWTDIEGAVNSWYTIPESAFLQYIRVKFTYNDIDKTVYNTVKDKVIIAGDVNFDGQVEIADVIKLQQYLALMIDFDYDERRAANINKDAVIDTLDVNELQKIVTKSDFNPTITISGNAETGQTLTADSMYSGMYQWQYGNTVWTNILNESDVDTVYTIADECQNNFIAAKLTYTCFGETKIMYTVLDDTVIMLGDVNQDGKITHDDAMMVQQHYARSILLDATQIRAADVNKDGAVDLFDSARIQQYAAGNITSFY